VQREATNRLVARLMNTNGMGSVTEIAHLERLVVSMTILGLSLSEIAPRTKLTVWSVKKLLDNVNRKIGTAREGITEGGKL
jgi:DNA-binding CsgD family transcriptional regulator